MKGFLINILNDKQLLTLWCIVPAIYNAVKEVHTMFYFNVTITHTYQYNVTQSKSYSQVKDDILKDVKERLSSFTTAVRLVKNMTMMSLIFVVIK